MEVEDPTEPLCISEADWDILLSAGELVLRSAGELVKAWDEQSAEDSSTPPTRHGVERSFEE